LFNGKEVKKEGNPFQEYQMEIIASVLGCPTTDQWPALKSMKEFDQISNPKFTKYSKNILSEKLQLDPKLAVFDLLQKMLIYDPEKRITATEALVHPFFKEEPQTVAYPFSNLNYVYPIDNPLNGQPQKRFGEVYKQSEPKRKK
jgi:cyclin-dependent kinase 8/11